MSILTLFQGFCVFVQFFALGAIFFEKQNEKSCPQQLHCWGTRAPK